MDKQEIEDVLYGDVLYILNFSDGKVYKIKPEKEYNDIDVLLKEYGFELDDICFMWSSVDTDCIIKAERKYEDS